jgi:hypothetical protein
MAVLMNPEASFAHYQNHQMDCFAEWIVIVVGFKSVQ